MARRMAATLDSLGSGDTQTLTTSMSAHKKRSDLFTLVRHDRRGAGRRARAPADRGRAARTGRPAASRAGAGAEDRRQPALAALRAALAAGDGRGAGAPGRGHFIADGRRGWARRRCASWPRSTASPATRCFEARRGSKWAPRLAADARTASRWRRWGGVASMFATLDQPVEFLRHDVQFHRAVAAASQNPVLAR